jgi:hypothetical protein
MADSTFGEEQPDFRFEDGVDDIGADDLGPTRMAVASSTVAASDQGPCLYLGPAGQRCYRRAVKGGFCALHQPGAAGIKRGIGKPSKLIAAVVGILGVLWPYIYDFLHELFRLFHPR